MPTIYKVCAHRLEMKQTRHVISVCGISETLMIWSFKQILASIGAGKIALFIQHFYYRLNEWSVKHIIPRVIGDELFSD